MIEQRDLAVRPIAGAKGIYVVL